MTQEQMRIKIAEDGRQHLVRELVENGGFGVDEAVEYVFDMKELSKAQFTEKYFG